MNTLHILNGSATFYVFKQTGIVGDVLIWHEILAEGPVAKTGLWDLRTKWMQENFNEDPSDYSQKVVTAAEKLRNLEAYDEVILWFEYDLVCQINLIYILSILNETIKSPLPIYLICPDKIEDVPNFRGLGELNPAQLLKLYDSKICLDKSDLEFASLAWDVYVNNDLNEINNFLKSYFGNLNLLKNALIAAISRFPKASNGLNHIEEVLLSLIHTGIYTRPELYAAFWLKEPIFGITDLQLGLVLNKLRQKGLVNI